jgi:D-alanyl-D-alanine carboxypeptidase
LNKVDSILASLGISLDTIAARSLVPYSEATELVVAETGEDGRQHRLVPPAARAWSSLKEAAHAERVDIRIVSAFRGIERQAEIVRAKLARGLSIDEILAVSAPPGYSEHHTGRAVDIGAAGCPPLDESFEMTAQFAWLQRNAKRFGFSLSYPRGNAQGYLYEPWHWCYRAKPR